jgi:ERCC4-type nuclease
LRVSQIQAHCLPIQQADNFLFYSGVRSLGYLVEGDVSKWSSSFGVAEQSVKAVGSATVQTEVWDGFSVIRTEHQKETFETYGRMTVAMTDLYGSLTSSDGAKPALCSSGDTTDHLPIPLQEYNARLTNTKRSLSTLRNVWGGMLMAVPGLGPEIAQGIIDNYPTPFSLNMAYGKCASKETASALLQSLPLTGNRTVGPLVSKKVFTSLFGHELTPRA